MQPVRQTYEIHYVNDSDPNKCPTFKLKQSSGSGNEEQVRLTDCDGARDSHETNRLLSEKVDRVCVGVVNLFIRGINKFRCYKCFSVCNRTNPANGDTKVSSKALWLIRIGGISAIVLPILAITAGVARSAFSGASNPPASDIPIITKEATRSASTTPVPKDPILECEKQLQNLMFLKCQAKPEIYDALGSNDQKWEWLNSKVNDCFLKPAHKFLGEANGNRRVAIEEMAEDKSQDFCSKAKLTSPFPLFNCKEAALDLEDVNTANRSLQKAYLQDGICLGPTSTFRV